MKIQCEVCDNHEATVFCVADEAALCAACDHRVHHADKIAGKHHRFSLHHPSAKQSPICDICQEKRAFLFCQQDRAILCRDCDVSIHRANQHTQKHSRFLLTGLKLSPNSTVYSSDSAPIPKPPNPVDKPVLASPTNAQNYYHDEIEGNSSSISSSSISEYLIEALPGWHVEELLDSTNYTIPSPPGNLSMSKSGGGDDAVMPFWDADLEGNNLGAFGIGKMGLWVPQVAPNLSHHVNITQVTSGAPIGIKEMSREFGSNMVTTKSTSRKWSQQTSLVVPQMAPSPTAS